MKASMMKMTAVAAALLMGTALASAQTMNSGSMKSGSMKHESMGKTVMVGGAPMYPNKTIVQNASKAKNLTTLVSAVKAAGLVDTLSGSGPFTVFAPTNAAFNKVPKKTLNSLMQPSMKSDLTKILTYHVVPGRLTAAELKKKIHEGHGSANLKTVEGEVLTVKMSHGHIVVFDKQGGEARVTKANVMQSNGVVHVVNAVLMP